MNTLLIAATVAVVSTVPVPSGDTGAVTFRKSELVVVFNQPVATHSVEVVDDDGCKVSQESVADGEKITIQLKACSRIGFPPGHMHVRWTVNGVAGDYELHVRKHH